MKTKHKDLLNINQVKIKHLEISGHDGFPVILNLSEFGSQTLHLVFHLHDILEIPLSAQVQHLNGLRHVLHLE